eukprot:PITA_06471
MFKDFITAVRSCHACQILDSKSRKPPTPLQPIVVVGPFTKWGIYFMTCNPTSVGGHGYIIVAVDYFTKWAEVMPTLNNNGETVVLFFFNHVVSRFGVPQAIVTDHGSHFHNHMMVELAAKLGLSHNFSTPYYPQANRQVEAIKKVLKPMLQRMIGFHKRDWHFILYSALWAYQTSFPQPAQDSATILLKAALRASSQETSYMGKLQMAGRQIVIEEVESPEEEEGEIPPHSPFVEEPEDSEVSEETTMKEEGATRFGRVRGRGGGGNNEGGRGNIGGNRDGDYRCCT